MTHDPMRTRFWRWWEAHEDFLGGFIFGMSVGVLLLPFVMLVLA